MGKSALLQSMLMGMVISLGLVGFSAAIAMPAGDPAKTCAANFVSQSMVQSQPLRPVMQAVLKQLKATVVGQDEVVTKTFITLLARGHLLIEGEPGSGKTRLIHAIGDSFRARVKTHVFTAYSTESDLIGERIFNQETRQYDFFEGAVFGDFLLADELNRATHKIHTGLMGAMEARKVSVAGEARNLSDTFTVLATQNPSDQSEGTSPLTSALKSRFMLILKMRQPNRETERRIQRLVEAERINPDLKPKPLADLAQLRAAQREADQVAVSAQIEDYILSIVDATRNPDDYPNNHLFARYLNTESGASSRASLALRFTGKAKAWLEGRSEVTIEDIDELALDALRDRFKISQDGRDENMTSETLIRQIMKSVKIKMGLPTNGLDD